MVRGPPYDVICNTDVNRDGGLSVCGERAGKSPQEAEDAVRVRLGEATEDYRSGRVLEGPTQRWYGHLFEIIRLSPDLSFLSPLPQSQCCPPSTVRRLRSVQRLLKRHVRASPRSTRRSMQLSQNLGEPLIKYVSLPFPSSVPSPLFPSPFTPSELPVRDFRNVCGGCVLRRTGQATEHGYLRAPL